jgi:hypothetical protein
MGSSRLDVSFDFEVEVSPFGIITGLVPGIHVSNSIKIPGSYPVTKPKWSAPSSGSTRNRPLKPMKS